MILECCHGLLHRSWPAFATSVSAAVGRKVLYAYTLCQNRGGNIDTHDGFHYADGASDLDDDQPEASGSKRKAPADNSEAHACRLLAVHTRSSPLPALASFVLASLEPHF